MSRSAPAASTSAPAGLAVSVSDVDLLGRPAPAAHLPTAHLPTPWLRPQEQAVFDVLASRSGRVVGRAELIRRAGLTGLGPRRCDSLIAGIRERIGHERVLTVRRRGWMLVDDTTGGPTSTPGHRPPEDRQPKVSHR